MHTLATLASARRLRLTVSAIAILALALSVTLSARAATPAEVKAQPDFTGVEFTEAMTARAAAELLASSGALVMNLQHSITAGNHTWSGGVDVSSALSSASIESAFVRGLRATFLDQLASFAAAGADARAGDAARESARASLQASAPSVARAVVVRAVITTDARAIAKLQADPRVRSTRSAAVAPGLLYASGRRGLAAPIAAPAQTHVARSSWVPDDVYVTFQPSSLGGRYVSQDIIWNAGRSLYFGDRGGYEAKLFLYNYGYTTYLTTGTWASGIPQVSAWNSNFPGSYYLDTRAGDPRECGGCEYQEVAYTIGVNGNDGWRIAAGTWYNTYIRTGNGSSSTGQAKMTPSLTSCTGTVCDTWNMFQHDLCPANYASGPYWNTPAPTWSWQWNRFNGGGNGAQPGCY